MRFSLKWALAAMAYVALAAAALSQRSPVWAGLLWTATIFAFCYALLVCFAWDDRRAAALGFVVVSIVYYLHQMVSPTQALPRQILVAAELDTWEEPISYEAIPTTPSMATDSDPFAPANPNSVTIRNIISQRTFATTRLQAASAIGVMAAGLTGALLGVLAFRRAANCGPGDAR